MRSHFSLSGIWHLALASGIWYMIYAFTSLSHFEHVHIYWHVHMFTCSHFYHIWKCERRYMRSHSRVKVVEPNDFPRSPTFFLPLTPSSPLIIEHLNIWTFEHLNIWTLEHWNIWTCWYLQHSTFYMRSHFYLRSHFSLSCHIHSLVAGCVEGTSICSVLKVWTQIYAVTFLSAFTFRLKMWTQISGVESHR